MIIRRLPLIRSIVPYVVITLLTIWITLPLIRQPFSTLVEDYDGALITWIMTWSAQSLLENPAQLYNAPILYPLTATYTFSDPMLSGALLGLPFWLLTKDPVVFSTVNYVLAVWLTAVFSYLLLKDMTGNRWSSLAGALLIGFSSIHFTYYIHLHTFMIQGIPLGLWAWWHFSRSRHRRWLLVWVVAFLFQALNGPLTGYLFLASHGLFAFDKESWLTVKSQWRWCMLALLTTSSVILFVYYPYIQAATFYQSQRSIRDAAHFALSLNTWWKSGGVWQIAFLGGSALLILGLFSKKMRKSLLSESLQKGALLTMLVCVLLAFGPVLKWSGETVKLPLSQSISVPVPLPYAVAYYVVPGMKAFRTPERWMVLAGMMLVILIALQWRNKPGVLITFALLVLVIEQPWRLPANQIADHDQRPAVYDWLDANQIKSALFIPTYVYDDQPAGARQETHRMLWTIGSENIIRLVNGYTGYAPQATLNGLKQYNQQFPKPEFWQRVQNENIQVVVVELHRLSDQQREQLAIDTRIRLYADDEINVFAATSSD